MNKLFNSIFLLRIHSKYRLLHSTSVLFIQHNILLNRNNNNIINIRFKMNTSTSTNLNTSTNDINLSTKCFKGKQDRYNGIVVDSSFEPCNAKEFYKKLQDSLNEWINNKKRCIWFKVDIEHAEWIPILTKNGFKFHHAKDNLVMLYKWLPTLEVCNIPPYAHTMLGVGALIINNNNNQSTNNQESLLVVQEKYFIGKQPYWKLPGGYVEPGEDLIAAAIREVYEETNIRCEFKSLISIRHTHNVMFGCSDLYIVLLLHPINNTSNDIKQCTRELLDCKWMLIEDYLLSKNVSDLNKSFVNKYLEYKQFNITINCTNAIHPILNKSYTLFNVTQNK